VIFPSLECAQGTYGKDCEQNITADALVLVIMYMGRVTSCVLQDWQGQNARKVRQQTDVQLDLLQDWKAISSTEFTIASRMQAQIKHGLRSFKAL